eukprot:CAMPEP_0115554362 /NCGR_PEP_ID=MMETSP0271-20121206/97254_1 /TAXON_ID=71861 /ORGANISM="Scrippsiella trochoidea, Strain CCMP3099" /LENGTH=170 /DNA_ID=CAMNT_0002988085 /DNA_START=132 /DNA_END=641 /DNA_ORIENTATION=+
MSSARPRAAWPPTQAAANKCQLTASLGPVDRGLDLTTLLADVRGAAVCHRHAHGQHGRLHATAASGLRGVLARLDGGDELGAGVDDVGPLEEDLLDAHVPVAGDAARVREPDRARGGHEGDVGDARQHDLAHDAVVGVHPQGRRGEDDLSDDPALGHLANGAGHRVVDLA